MSGHQPRLNRLEKVFENVKTDTQTIAATINLHYITEYFYNGRGTCASCAGGLVAWFSAAFQLGPWQ